VGVLGHAEDLEKKCVEHQKRFASPFLCPNPYWGPIEHEGKRFEQMKAYITNKDRISAIVRIPNLKEETFGRDLSDMLQERLTFDEALAMDSRTIMTRQRLTLIKGQLFGQMDAAAVV
jgi:hypothetical protein